MIDLWKLAELLHGARHSEGAHVTVHACPFHDHKAFERQARRLREAVRLGIGKRR